MIGGLLKMVKCAFCGQEENSYKGVHLLKNDGSIDYFCSSKCRKNSTKLGRDKRKLKWTGAFLEVRTKKVLEVERVKKKTEEKDTEVAADPKKKSAKKAKISEK
jgi:large subunit ribosomal protein L24e